MQDMQNSDKKNVGKERVGKKRYECAFKNGGKEKKKDLHSFASLVIK